MKFAINSPAQNYQQPISAGSIFVLLGAFGDLAIMLPLFRDIYQKTQIKPIVVVSKNYAPMFEGVSYVEVMVNQETYDRKDTNACRRISDFAKSKFPNNQIVFLNPIEAYGGRVPQETDSFVKEFWKIAGRPFEWGIHPLIFDKRNAEREAELIRKHTNGKPLILAALTGFTSPFPQKDELLASLRERFPEHQVLDLFDVKAEYPFDLLGLFDAAKLLVTVDTMHLHLSRASNVPVIAIARDYPTNWNGSPWHKRFQFYCRYGEFQMRKEELLHAADDALGDVLRAQTMPVDGLFDRGYNGSIYKCEDGFILAYRWHPQKNPRTKLAIAKLDGNFRVQNNQQIEFPHELLPLSLEDPRLFNHRGQLYLSYTASTFPSMPPKCVIQYAELKFENNQWFIGQRHQVKFGKNDWTGMEKNHVFFSRDGKLYCIYQNHPDRVVLEIDGDNVVAEHRSEVLPWAYGQIRGGTEPLQFGDDLIQFCHSRTHNGKRDDWWRYYTFAVVMENKPPFKMLKISRQPVLAGHEWKPHDCFHAKHNVCIPYGDCVVGNEFVVSVGLNDATCCVSHLNEKQLRLP